VLTKFYWKIVSNRGDRRGPTAVTLSPISDCPGHRRWWVTQCRRKCPRKCSKMSADWRQSSNVRRST